MSETHELTDGGIWITKPSTHWVVDEAKTQDYWLEVNDGEGWYRAVVKRDGCVDFHRFFNAPWGITGNDDDPDECYIHICDIDDMIERLQELKAMATAHYGSWPD